MKEKFKTTIMSVSDLQSSLGLKGAVGRVIAKTAYDILGLDGINRIQDNSSEYFGAEFAEHALKDLGVDYSIPQEQLERIPKEGGFIIVANHHFGSIDGLIMAASVGNIRPDFKLMTTFLLSRIPSLKDIFIPVDNFSSGKARSLNGIRTAMAHIAAGNCLGLFPAGEVATWQRGKNRTSLGKKRVVEDIPWAHSVIKLVQRSGLPVIPMYFDGENSKLFHRLGRIHPRLRTARLMREALNKQGTHVEVRIGQAIQPEEIAALDTNALATYLRSRCYALEQQTLPDLKPAAHEWPAAVDDATDANLVAGEMENLPTDKILFENGDYRVCLIRKEDAPNAMRELYRLREVTFRAVGEGTGKPLDTDSYDDYFYQLIVWNIPNREIVGAYRIGDGKEIMEQHGGIGGFYTASLVNYKDAAAPILAKSIELGRSFVVDRYKKEFSPLKLLLGGIAACSVKFPHAEYLMGPVSISNDFPVFYKSLTTHYIKREFPLPEADRLVTAPHPFVPDYLRVNPDDLLQTVPKGDIAGFDTLLSAISDGEYHLPVLVRRYFSCSARLACFNVDPDFADSLDGLILLRLSEYPVSALKAITRGMPDELRDGIFEHLYGTIDPQ